MHPMLASMASESRLRTQKWLANGCNGFDLKEPVSNPMSFWTDNDILLYIKEYNLPICKVYGDIVTDYRGQKQCDGQMSFADLGLFDNRPVLTTTGCLRTGCVGCGFGLMLEKRPNRLELIDKVSNPKMRDFILRGGAFDENGLWKPDNRGLGFWFVHKYIALALKKDLFIPEYDRYEKEYGNELTEMYLEQAKMI
jgi:3'-phosphoadenosine 5'-phosphosulfate sulfotransferase (PAPS reductase)/FAD synthetase